MTDPVLEECPDCGGENLTPADEVNGSMWDDTDTACHDCEIPWLVVAFAVGTLFGGSVVVALLMMILSEIPFTIKKGNEEGWKYE